MTERPLASWGFTLIEMLVAIVIIGVALAGVLSVFQVTTKASADPVEPKQALLIAESLLEEIMTKRYAPPPENNYDQGIDRAQFDDVGDYNGYTSSGAYALSNLSAPIDGLKNYIVSVSVGGETAVRGAPCRAITVTVSVHGNAYELSTYRCNDYPDKD